MDHLGYGTVDAPPIEYGPEYFEHYRRLDDSSMGARLTAARVEMVRRHWAGEIIDIGIGGGRFVVEAGASGYDINPSAIDWLLSAGKYANPYHQEVDAMTLWDSLEHIADPAALLSRVRRWLFVSMPIYRDREHCLASKHFKPGEHIWYFTDAGFVRWSAGLGFHLCERNVIESLIGRDGIVSYAFRRVRG